MKDNNLPNKNLTETCLFNINRMKQFIVSSLFQKFIIFAVALFLLILGFGHKKVLTISNQETKEVYFETIVNEGDILEYSWIHSFEHIPWKEEYKIQKNNNLLLTSIAVAGFGAGIPENKGTVSVENGIIYMREINQNFEEINWINSNTALTYIGLNGEVLIKGSDLPHHVPCNLIVKERFFYGQEFARQ